MARILIADDDDLIRSLLFESLTQNGHEVAMARNGAEAVKIARATLPALIVLDIDMPILTGLEACKQLRAHPSTKSTPIMMLTARNSDDAMTKGINTGADVYMTKPLALAEFNLRVQMLLGS